METVPLKPGVPPGGIPTGIGTFFPTLGGGSSPGGTAGLDFSKSSNSQYISAVYL